MSATSVLRVPALKQLARGDRAVDEVADGFRARTLHASDFPALIKDLLGVFAQVRAVQPALKLEPELAAMEQSMGSPAAAQKAHRAFLLKLERLAPRTR